MAGGGISKLINAFIPTSQFRSILKYFLSVSLLALSISQTFGYFQFCLVERFLIAGNMSSSSRVALATVSPLTTCS